MHRDNGCPIHRVLRWVGYNEAHAGLPLQHEVGAPGLAFETWEASS